MDKEWLDLYNIENDIYEEVKEIDKSIKKDFYLLDEIEEYNTFKVLNAFHEEKLSSTDFKGTTGYGYGDDGRDKAERIFARIFKSEDALVRPSIASGTHALALCLNGILLPGDHLLSISGTPYDTMQQVIGITGDEPCTLIEQGIEYSEVPLNGNKLQGDKILKEVRTNTKLLLIQRSTGYSLRSAISLEDMEKIIGIIKEKYPNIIIMVDNCYGEFTQKKEPIEIGADLCAGSLIKNLSGGIAVSGGYIVSTHKIIQRIANRLTAPGLGKEVGLSFNTTRLTLQGLYFAPKVVMEAMKGSKLFALAFHKKGYKTIPDIHEERYDIIQAIILKEPEKVIQFCQSIQKAASVDSYVSPQPWPMPGYENEIIMASGSFIDGSSIELSADGPLREPYCVYYQGGLSYYQCKLALMMVLQNLKNNNLL